ncbi:hypothetical protein QEZ54_22785 [Catellatospora sp. KI3]|uniref:hypothetical protein n=1 Tax=Catellatospora sp. KI3 TaxID=3041620 RepID=UPI0024832A8B|nr:hypothetical protein [Catellatospora sp. KI3]MDI1463815.1 hypothetical protein [Catellatospora sp. KI3]
MSDLRELLGDLAGGARTGDFTERALVLGRRRRAGRRIGASIAAALTAALLGGVVVQAAARRDDAPPPPPSPTPSTLTPPRDCVAQYPALPAGYEGGRATVTGGDPTGRYLVGGVVPSTDAAPGSQPALWDGGEPQAVPVEGGMAEFAAVNSAGTAVGRSYVDDSVWQPWAYRNGAVIRMKGYQMSPMAINSAGVVVGYQRIDGDGHHDRPVRWRTVDGEPELLPLPKGMERWWGMAVAIDDDGTVAGFFADDKAEGVRSFLWAPDGSVRELVGPPQPGVTAAQLDTRVTAIRGGWVTGYSGDFRENGTSITTLWNLATDEVRLVESPSINRPVVNAKGWLVGAASGGGLAAVRGADVLELPKPAGSGSYAPVFVSDDGRVVAAADQVLPMRGAALVWHCS